ncbi:MAG: ribulokinase [Chloroflexota bacterium]
MYVIGLDFGTLSVRALLVDAQTGEIVTTSVSDYAHAVIEETLPNSMVKLSQDWALQHPQDWLDGLQNSILAILKAVPETGQVRGIGIDFTASTPLPVDASGTALCELASFAAKPHAWPKLWKHHAAQSQATRMTDLALAQKAPWLARYGGIISSEWLLPKAMQIMEEDPETYAEIDLFVEGGDWVAWQLTGNFQRNACAAGFKGQWHKADGYPDEAYLTELHPQLTDFYQTKGRGAVVPPGSNVGTLTSEWATRLGLPETVQVAVGLIDAHAGVVGAGVTQPDILYMAMGTSTCHMLMAPQETLCAGISGVVEDGILPDWFTYEAGQAAVGDIFNWFTEHVGLSHDELTTKAAQFNPGESGLLALDWWNGCRTPLVDAGLSGVLLGYTLQTPPEAVYRALLEATAYGTRLIVETYTQTGLEINRLRVSGGLTKNDLLLQIYADVVGLPIEICSTDQASGLGAAILGAAASGIYPSLAEAMKAMAPKPSRVISPNSTHQETYNGLYKIYKEMVDLFGDSVASPLRKLREIDQR